MKLVALPSSKHLRTWIKGKSSWPPQERSRPSAYLSERRSSATESPAAMSSALQVVVPQHVAPHPAGVPGDDDSAHQRLRSLASDSGGGGERKARILAALGDDTALPREELQLLQVPAWCRSAAGGSSPTSSLTLEAESATTACFQIEQAAQSTGRRTASFYRAQSRLDFEQPFLHYSNKYVRPIRVV